MTDEEIQALQALAERATKGPWANEDPLGPDMLSIVEAGLPPHQWRFIASIDAEGGEISRKEAKANAAFIAASRDAVPALCAELLAARAMVAVLREDNDILEDANEELGPALAKALNERDTLRADVARLREALRKIADAPAWCYPEKFEVTPAEVRILARAVLEERQ